MIALLVATVIFVMVSGWFVAEFFLRFPSYIFHSFDWLLSWINVFDKVGHWITLTILVLILSWFLRE